jgi:hypothetical protein
MMPSPQIGVQTAGTAVLQVHPGSMSQVDEQPSPLATLPCSQASPPVRKPSPHTATLYSRTAVS